MKKISFIITGLILFSASSCLFAQETVTITTYYPAPYGIYDALRLNPNDTPPSCFGVADAGNIGMLHFDNRDPGIGDGIGLYVCNDQGGGNAQWELVAVDSGGTGCWAINDSEGDGNLLHQGDACCESVNGVGCGLDLVVGMGTTQPGEYRNDAGNLRTWSRVRLHVVDPNNVLPLTNRRFCRLMCCDPSRPICTSWVTEGKDSSTFQIMSEYNNKTRMSHVALTGIDESGTAGHRLWFLSAWGEDRDNEFGIGYMQTPAGADSFDVDPEKEYFIISKTGNVNIKAELDIGFEEIIEPQDSESRADDLVKAESKAYCTDGKKPFTGGCNCGTCNSDDDVWVRESRPMLDGIGWYWYCECNATIDASAGACKTAQAIAYCSYISDDL